jgi:nucleoside-diphosphate-sugar epimerase
MSEPTALITGSKGFIGSHLEKHLTQKGYRVIGVDRGDPFPNATPNMQIDYVFHLAGEKNASKVKNAKQSVSTADLLITNEVIHFAKKFNAKKVVLISTLGVYGVAGNLNEQLPTIATSDYTELKLAIEQVGLKEYLKSGLPISVARLSNIYGPNQSTEAIIPLLIEQMNARDAIKTGNTHTVRDFLFVEDLCAAFEMIAVTPKTAGEIFNIGSGIGTAIEDIILMLKAQLHYTGTIEKDPLKCRPDEIPIQIADISKIKSFTGWSPQIKLSEGIMKTIKFYKAQKSATQEKNV